MNIQDFKKKYILNITINETHPVNIEFHLETILRATLQPTLDYKRIKSEAPVEWLSEKIEEEVLAGRHPGKFTESFYDNMKRKLINTFLIKNSIIGFDALNTENDISSLTR